MITEGDLHREFTAASKQKRAANRDASARNLTNAGIAFAAKNGGTHLIVSHTGTTADFWSSTGLWIVHGTNEKRRGVRHLIRRLRGHKDLA